MTTQPTEVGTRKLLTKRNNMILQRIILEGTEYYQWVHNRNVGDIFTNWRDINREKTKLQEQLGL